MMDFRRRNLIVLGAAALVSVALAVTALTLQARRTEAHFTPGPFLPGFSAHVKDAARIHVVSHTGAFDVVYRPDKGWVLPDKGDYPADFDQVRHTLIGLAALEAVEPKTARADWLSYVGLTAPPKGDGISLTVSDRSGKVLASVITGSSAQLPDPTQGGSGLFVRRPGENQTYLARTVFTPHGNLSDWLLTAVLNVEPARVNSVTITPFSGPAYTVSREHSSDMDFTLKGPPPPKGTVASTSQIDLVPDIVSGFGFTDVKPASTLDFSKAAHLKAHTFDNQNILMDAVKAKGAVWVRISARPDPGTPTAQKQEAAAINARAANWAYELATERGQFFSMKRDNFFAKAPPSRQFGGSSFPGAPN